MAFPDSRILLSIGLVMVLHPPTLAPGDVQNIERLTDRSAAVHPTPFSIPIKPINSQPKGDGVMNMSQQTLAIHPVDANSHTPTRAQHRPSNTSHAPKSLFLEADLVPTALEFDTSHIHMLTTEGEVEMTLPDGQRVTIELRRTDSDPEAADHPGATQRIYTQIGEYPGLITRREDRFFATFTTAAASYRIEGNHDESVAYIQRYFADRAVAADFKPQPARAPRAGA